MSLQRLSLVRFHDLHPQRRALRGLVTYTCNLILLSTSLLSKKCFAAPMRDLAFLILVSISRSSFSSGVIRLPRYLNLFTKWIFLFTGSKMCLGSIFSQILLGLALGWVESRSRIPIRQAFTQKIILHDTLICLPKL